MREEIERVRTAEQKKSEDLLKAVTLKADQDKQALQLQ